jgi:hypothetical protein
MFPVQQAQPRTMRRCIAVNVRLPGRVPELRQRSIIERGGTGRGRNVHRVDGEKQASKKCGSHSGIQSTG